VSSSDTKITIYGQPTVGEELKLNTVADSFGATTVELITDVQETNYTIEHASESVYILTINNSQSFTMINGSLTFSSNWSNKTLLSFTNVAHPNSFLYLRNVKLHFGSVMNCLVYVTSGKVTINNMILKDEGVKVDGQTVEIIWVNPIVKIDQSGNNGGDVIVEFLSSTIEDSRYKASGTSIFNSVSSIIHTIEVTGYANNLIIHINDSKFVNNIFDLQKRTSAICRFQSNTSNSGIVILFYTNFFI
jgi:hypothetical protein